MPWPWILGIIVFVILLFSFLVILRGRLLRRSNVSVPLCGLPKEFDGFRIALIADLHDRKFGKGNVSLIKAVLSCKPDIVVTAGDMHEGSRAPDPVYALYEGLSKEVPVFYTEGNHDLRKNRRVPVTSLEYEVHLSRLSQAGATILNDTVLPLERKGKEVFLYGQSWNSTIKGPSPTFQTDKISILVCHDPMQFDRLDSLPDLMLSGHVHGGLIRLPFIGPVFAPGNGAPVYKRFSPRFFFPKYSHGIYRKGRHILAVTQGLGFAILPVRFIRPEIMVITLRSDKK